MVTLADMLPVAAEHLWATNKDARRTLKRALKVCTAYDPTLPTITDPYGNPRDRSRDYNPLAAKAALLTLGSGPTFNRHRSALSSLLRAYRLTGGPRLELPPMAPENPPKDRVLTPAEESAILSTMDPHWLSPLVTILIDTGLRLGEVNRAVRDGDGLSLGDTKNGHPRWVPLTPRCLPLVPLEGPLGRHLGLPPERTLRRAWGRAMGALGIHGVTPHTLRHTAITNLSERLKDRSDALPVVMAIVGHRSPNTTLRYLHPSRETLTQAIR